MLNIVFFCIIFIFLGIIFSKIKISIEKIELNINNVNFKVKISFLLFGFIKIIGVQCDKNGIKILGKLFSYEKLFKLSLKEIIKKNLKKRDLKIAKKLNVKIDLARFTLKIGADDMFVTVFLVTLLSGIIAEFLKQKIHKINKNNMYYKVLPEFNKFEVYYEGKTDISIKTLNLGSTIFSSK